MYLLVRDEDVPSVAATITVQAADDGLTPAAAPAEDPLAMLASLGQPRALIRTAGDSIVVAGLESLDIAEPDEWASRVSGALETEVVAFEIAEDGVRVWVYSEGEEESAFEVPFTAGRIR